MRIKPNKALFALTAVILATLVTSAQDATGIVRKANDKMEGSSSRSEMVMTVVRPSWVRKVSFRSWTRGRDFALTLITDPPKESGQSFLKLKNDMWSWNPTINRMIKLPPSMMSQGWMGSDYTNDDILKESSIVLDYSHSIIGQEMQSDHVCYKISLTPKEESAVVWGKIILWISMEENLLLRAEYYDEDDCLVKTHILSGIRLMSDRRIPTHFEIIPAGKPSQRTLVDIIAIEFDIPVPEEFFSQQNMKNVK